MTLFPGSMSSVLGESIIGRAAKKGAVEINCVQIRDYTENKQMQVDDYPYGGGWGLVMMAQPLKSCLDDIMSKAGSRRSRVIYMSPQGKPFNQQEAKRLRRDYDHLVLVCGHYEGIDERFIEECVDEELSLGDFVLTGGEIAAMAVADCVCRMVPGVLADEECYTGESHWDGLLEYPQYTRPAVYQGMRVPDVLQGGDHAKIVAWRREQSLEITLNRRPEMLDTAPLTDEDLILIARLKRAQEWIARLGENAARADFSEADAFAKRWFTAFVPEENRKAAKKQCFSGRRHVGYLWQAFSMGFAPAETVERAILDATGPGWLYLPEDAVLLQIGALEQLSAEQLEPIPSYILADAALAETCVKTGKKGAGPYRAKIARP